MGGYRLRCLSIEKDHIPSRYGRLTKTIRAGSVQSYWDIPLSFETMMSAVNEGYINLPSISEDDLYERSGRDGLSRAITMMQLIWFIVQIAVRKHQSLAITAIELAMATLAGLNIAMYMTWRSKPMDILHPTRIMSRAAFAEQRERATFPSHPSPSAETNDNTLSEAPQNTDPPRVTIALSQGAAKSREVRVNKAEIEVGDKENVNFTSELSNAIVISCAKLVTWIVEFISKLLNKARYIKCPVMKLSCDQHPPSISNQPSSLTRKVQTTISRTWSTITYPFLALFYYPIQAILDSGRNLHATGLQNEVEGLDEIPTSRFIFDKTKLRFSMDAVFFCENVANAPSICLSALSMALFGMIHCLAWNLEFPSHIERLLWRTSSAVLTGLCVFVVIGVLVNSLIETFHPRWKMPSSHSDFKTCITAMVCKTCVFLVVFSRLSLLMLSVAQLRDLPASAFDTVKWLDIFPHV